MRKINLCFLIIVSAAINAFSQNARFVDTVKIPEAAMKKILFQREELIKQGRTLKPLSILDKKGGQPVPFAGCDAMGVENGWGGWEASAGDFHYLNLPSMTWGPSVAPTAPQFNITNGSGIDPCTPGGGGPPIPVVAPGFGNSSILLGEPETPGSFAGCSYGCVEQLVFPLAVNQDTNFVYAYAIVLENPSSGHKIRHAPFAEIYILDQNGDTVPCSHRKYMGDTTGAVPPGMYQTTCVSSGAYKPWTTVGVNLKPYVGSLLTVVILNADCAQGGHFCHSYWDFACSSIPINPFSYCPGNSVTLSGPPSLPSHPYTYQWYQNTVPYNSTNHWTPYPGGNTQTIMPIPQPGDTFMIQVKQPGGCDFFVTMIPKLDSIRADFSFSGVCGQMTFTDLSTSPTASNPISAWNWQFAGGNPTSSSVKNPGLIQYPAGTYTVNLIATSVQGCKDTIEHSFTVDIPAQAAFTNTIPCLGAATTLSDISTPPPGDPIINWNWTIPSGNPPASALQNASTIYNIAGTHSVTLVVTTQDGCKDTVVQEVFVYDNPIADFSAPDSGCSPVCANFFDQSNAVYGAITSWEWKFPGGSPGVSTQVNPQDICYNIPGTYSVALTVRTNYGCADTVELPTITVFPWPTADFCVDPIVASAIDPVFHFCDLWSSDVVQWEWNFGDNETDIINTDPIHSYSASVTNNDFYSFNVCVNVQTKHGCWDEICHVVELIPEYTFYIPNTFTPNHDSHNDLFFAKSRGVLEYSIWIFDRWGNQIWDCHYDGKSTDWDTNGQDGLSSACKWDGKVDKGGVDMGGGSGRVTMEDVYVWKVSITDIFKKQHTYVGNVNIVK